MDAVKMGWYVIYTKPRHEKKVASYLDELNIQHFLPTLRTLRIWPGKKKYMTLPLFPSYVFVKLDDVRNYFESLRIPGVLHYVRVGSQIATISEVIIHKLQSFVTRGGQDIEVSAERFDPGRVLHIERGPFAGFSCEVIRYKGRQKMLVRIELLHRNIMLDLPMEYVAAPIPA
jgi:transcriptional antiterminator RfaH